MNVEDSAGAGGIGDLSDPTIPISQIGQVPQSAHGPKDNSTPASANPYASAPNKKNAKSKGQLKKASANHVGEARKFLKKEHGDSNMVVAVRIRPLSNKEITNRDIEVV